MAPSLERTAWDQILALYDGLFAQQPTAVVELNRAVVVAEVHGPARALSIVDGLPLERYHLWHATRANLLGRLGRDDEARAAYLAAAELAPTEAEQRFLDGQSGRADSVGPWCERGRWPGYSLPPSCWPR